MEATLSIGGRHVLSAPVMVDRAWAQSLGIPGAKGARRVGDFYRVPRAEYLRLMKAQADPETSPCFRWTEGDDRALAEFLESDLQDAPCGSG
jgi:hypothetical protein